MTELPKTQEELDRIIKSRIKRVKEQKDKATPIQPMSTQLDILSQAIQHQGLRITKLTNQVDKLTVKLDLLLDSLSRKDIK